jgi:hypothetical protein
VGITVVGAIGEALMWAPLASRSTGDVHFRLAGVPAALLAAATIAPYLLDQGLSSVGVMETIAGAGASVLGMGVGLAGALMLAAAWPVQSWLKAAESTDADEFPQRTGAKDPYGFD